MPTVRDEGVSRGELVAQWRSPGRAAVRWRSWFAAAPSSSASGRASGDEAPGVDARPHRRGPGSRNDLHVHAGRLGTQQMRIGGVDCEGGLMAVLAVLTQGQVQHYRETERGRHKELEISLSLLLFSIAWYSSFLVTACRGRNE